MMHERKITPFWRHHVTAFMAAVTIMAAARLIGAVALGVSIPDIILHSIVLVSVTFPLQTALAYLMMTQMPGRLSLSVRALIGCLLAAPIAAIIAPVLSWFMGVAPLAIVTAQTRNDLWAAIGERYPVILLLHLILGPVLWLSLNFHWWRDWFATVQAREDANANDLNGATNGETPGPLFMSKLPVAKRGDLIALSAELHYVRVYTTNGNDLVLMRISDAIEQTNGISGMRIHRSHWIAQGEVEHIRFEDGRMTARLSNKTDLPVARSYQGAVRNALPQFFDH